jgi:hypothetical protein
MRPLMTTEPPAAGAAAARRFHFLWLAACLAPLRRRWRRPRLSWHVPWTRPRSGPPTRRRSIQAWSALALFYLLIAVTWTWTGAAPQARLTAETVLAPEDLAPGSASHRALQESAFWWAQAVQEADDACDAEREALKAWDPEARTDNQAEICRLLAVDRDGYLRQARGAALRAAAWTHTPEERMRAKRQLTRLARAAGHCAAEPWHVENG